MSENWICRIAKGLYNLPISFLWLNTIVIPSTNVSIDSIHYPPKSLLTKFKFLFIICNLENTFPNQQNPFKQIIIYNFLKIKFYMCTTNFTLPITLKNTDALIFTKTLEQIIIYHKLHVFPFYGYSSRRLSYYFCSCYSGRVHICIYVLIRKTLCMNP